MLVPFALIVYEAFGETAAKCEDLSLMLDLVKCKPFFLRRLSLIVLSRISEEHQKVKLSSLLNTNNLRDEANAVLDFYVKQEVIRLLRSFCRPDCRADEQAVPDSSGPLYSTVKYDIISSWMQKRGDEESGSEKERETEEKESDTTERDKEKDKNEKKELKKEDRELRLDMLNAIPSQLHLNDIIGINYLSLVIDLLNDEEDPIVMQALLAKLHCISINAISVAFRLVALSSH